MQKVRLGIIGVGNIGSTHTRNIMAGRCPEIDLCAVADLRPERLAWAEENAPKAVRFKTAEELLAYDGLDAVFVCTPHYDHPPLAIAALRRGLHAIIEKPAGVYTKQAREMNEFAAKQDKVFAIMYQQRTSHIFRKMRELVQGGTLGQIKRTSWIITDWYRTQAYYDSGEWRATWTGEGGGVLLNQCPHNLDLWQWICGLPVLVDAKLHFGKWRKIEVEDDVSAYVEYENGATGTFVTTTADTPGSNRFEITMEGGKLLAENDKLTLWKLGMPEPEWSATTKEGFGRPPCEKTDVETDGSFPQHPGVLNAFAGAILRGEPLIARGEEGIRGLTLSNAMHLSAWLGKPVEIPFDEDLFYDELMKRVRGIATTHLK